MLLADGARESWGAVASAMLLRASRTAVAIEVVIAAVVAAVVAIVAVAIEMMDQVAMENLMVVTVVVLNPVWARSVRGASGVAVLPASGFLV